MASPVWLRLSLAVCTLHACAACAAGETSLSSVESPPSRQSDHVDSNVFAQALGQVPSWDRLKSLDLDLPEQFSPLLDDSAGEQATCSTLVYLRVSREYLSKRFEKEVHRTKPVTDLILGTHIRGKSLTRGQTRMVLIPSGDKFVADIEFTGTVESHTRGTNGPAILYYKSDSTFHATKRITIDDRGLTVTPARATAKTRLKPLRIESRRGGLVGAFIERVARRRVARSRHEANAIASDHTAQTIRGDLDRGLEKSLGVLTAALAEAAGLKPSELAQLTTSGSGERLHLMLRTTRDHAELLLTPQKATWAELAGALPAVEGPPHVALRVHRSALNSTSPNSSASPALARLLAHGMKTQLAKRSAALVELPAKANDLPIDWSINLNWLCVDVGRQKSGGPDAFRSAQVAVEPSQPSLGGGQ